MRANPGRPTHSPLSPALWWLGGAWLLAPHGAGPALQAYKKASLLEKAKLRLPGGSAALLAVGKGPWQQPWKAEGKFLGKAGSQMAKVSLNRNFLGIRLGSATPVSGLSQAPPLCRLANGSNRDGHCQTGGEDCPRTWRSL